MEIRNVTPFAKSTVLRTRLTRWIAALLVLMLAHVAPAYADGAADMRDKYQSLAQQFAHNPFHRSLSLDSSESQSALKGDIYAVLDYPFATVNGALNDPAKGAAN